MENLVLDISFEYGVKWGKVIAADSRSVNYRPKKYHPYHTYLDRLVGTSAPVKKHTYIDFFLTPRIKIGFLF